MPDTIPTFDFASRAKITRKALERLASFSKMQSSSQSNPLLDKTLVKINGLVKLLDSSILSVEYAYQFSSAAMIESKKEKKEVPGTNMEQLSKLASKGADIAQEVATGFKEIDQTIYKIAASTKDNTSVVQITPDPTQTATVSKNLKEVGIDLVANLKLFNEFSRAIEEISEWWISLKDKLVSEAPSLPHLTASESKPGEHDEQSALWSSMKENTWEYYTIVDVVQQRFPDLLGPSIAAWKSAAAERDSSAKIQSEEESHKGQKKGKFIGRLISRLRLFSEKRTRNPENHVKNGDQETKAEVTEQDSKASQKERASTSVSDKEKTPLTSHVRGCICF